MLSLLNMVIIIRFYAYLTLYSMLRLQFSSSLPHRITEQIPLTLAMCTYQIRHRTVILQEKNVKMSTFPSFTEFTQSLFYRLIHKTLSSNWIQILLLHRFDIGNNP